MTPAESISSGWGARWDSYFMSMAYLAATQSRDISTHIGAVIVSPEKRIVSVGYNSFPSGIDDTIPERQERPLKYSFMAHAERNAIYSAANLGVSVRGCVMVTPGFPCSDCAIAIIQAGIKEVVLHTPWDLDMSGGPKWEESAGYSRKMFEEAGVFVRYYDGIIRMIGTHKRGKPVKGVQYH